MRLSEAIRLGSLLMLEPEGGCTETCAIGMALLAVDGQVSRTIKFESEFLPEIDGEDANYDRIEAVWPWLGSWEGRCPKCHERLEDVEAVWHVFDFHVMRDDVGKGDMTIEQLADFIASIEPTDEPQVQVPAETSTTQEKVGA